MSLNPDGLCELCSHDHPDWDYCDSVGCRCGPPRRREPVPLPTPDYANLSMKVGVAVIITRVDSPRILVGRRGMACKSGAGYFAFPGGHVLFGETLMNTCHREVREETGLDVVIKCQPTPGTGALFVTDNRPKENTLTFWFQGLQMDREPPQRREPDKCDNWLWMTMTEVQRIAQVGKPEQNFWLPYDLLRQHVSFCR